jgi:meso-butanediol dehydrogenase / (S,S)-butanediol dehydrogenase / diacetyl reductase
MSDTAMDELAVARGITGEKAYALATPRVPLGRPATAEEIAACCLFLASDESSIATGTLLVADGGGAAVDVGSLAFDTGPTA